MDSNKARRGKKQVVVYLTELELYALKYLAKAAGVRGQSTLFRVLLHKALLDESTSPRSRISRLSPLDELRLRADLGDALDCDPFVDPVE